MDALLLHRRVTIAAIVSLLAFAVFTVVAMSPSLHRLDRDVGTAVQDARHPRLEAPMRVTFSATVDAARTHAGDGRARRAPRSLARPPAHHAGLALAGEWA
jgi:hypothetical protein